MGMRFPIYARSCCWLRLLLLLLKRGRWRWLFVLLLLLSTGRRLWLEGHASAVQLPRLCDLDADSLQL
jgi:hypothetical protein